MENPDSVHHTPKGRKRQVQPAIRSEMLQHVTLAMREINPALVAHISS